jgi:predicted nucleic acid-binding protein
MKAKSITELKPNFNSRFFLDTNIWLYLYFPQNTSIAEHIIDNYSKTFDEIVAKKCMIITDMIQMSEIINLVLRIEYNQYLKINSKISFKDFRDTTEYKNALTSAKTITTNIIKNTTLRSGIFSADDLGKIVQKCDQADFNDIYFTHLCLKEEASIITHDFDFKAISGNLNIFTFNKKYLF